VLAIAIATPGGVGSLTIRLLAQHRDVKPMAIRTRLLTDTELVSVRLGPWISPQDGLLGIRRVRVMRVAVRAGAHVASRPLGRDGHGREVHDDPS
jgi:hypothetical protein